MPTRLDQHAAQLATAREVLHSPQADRKFAPEERKRIAAQLEEEAEAVDILRAAGIADFRACRRPVTDDPDPLTVDFARTVVQIYESAKSEPAEVRPSDETPPSVEARQGTALLQPGPPTRPQRLARVRRLLRLWR